MPKYHMHKAERQITDRDQMLAVLRGGKYATIALCRGDEPYVVTLNYGYDQANNCLYFHSAQRGLKIDFLSANARVCATVIEDRGYVDGRCSHKYRTVVFWGRMKVVEDLAEKKRALSILIRHLESHPEGMETKLKSAEEAYGKVAVLRLDISEMTGKENT
jgi:nitroimidazol reductase NimA-like FMN-containing flavoprotein (pyridoxamine 5'-phosphate oxidase superfamily)